MRVIEEIGDYRIIEETDFTWCFENLEGDTYSPDCHPDIPADQLQREQSEFRDLVGREGVYGYVLERWNPEVGKGWEHVDSCWGFVGQYIPHEDMFNHYIVDELRSHAIEYTTVQIAVDTK